MKKLGYLGLSMIPGVVLSLAMISGCNSEEAAPPVTPPADAPKMEPAGEKPAAEPTPAPADAKKE